MADLQTSPEEELCWDLRAFEAAQDLNNDRLRAYHTSLDLATFFPSLHLNIAEDYRKLGKWGEAQEHLKKAREGVDLLPEDGYGKMIRGGIIQLAERLAQKGR
jgi:hypothetical protein